MKRITADICGWQTECLPDSGGRLSYLRYGGIDLLTSAGEDFFPPSIFSGEFETRPVFGYDDCFPTVDTCEYPVGSYISRDHGELCQTKWDCSLGSDRLICKTQCPVPKTEFSRTLVFERDRLTWIFEVTNISWRKIVFLHVMHALLDPALITGIVLPRHDNVFDEAKSCKAAFSGPEMVSSFLLNMKEGDFSMLLLRDLRKGELNLELTSGKTLKINFDRNLFPTLGIWWNRRGYPQSGKVRNECAFEPIPGTCSDLSASFRDGVYLSADPGRKVSWQVVWNMI